jgi:hypothetical protein
VEKNECNLQKVNALMKSMHLKARRAGNRRGALSN